MIKNARIQSATMNEELNPGVYLGASLFAKCGIKNNPNVSIRKENR